MLLVIMIITALVASAFITGTIKHNMYKNIPDKEINEDNINADLFFTALGVIIISNLIPFMLGAVIGIYAIL